MFSFKMFAFFTTSLIPNEKVGFKKSVILETLKSVTHRERKSETERDNTERK